MFKNKFFIFMIMILALLTIGVASAEDSSNVDITGAQESVSVSDESILNTEEITTLAADDVSSDVVGSEENDTNVISQSTNDNSVVKDEVHVGSFNDLQDTIKEAKGNILDLDCDYEYNKKDIFSGIIINQNNFVIDGHGHTIEANSSDVRIFNIAGNNVTIKNLILTNAKYAVGAAIYTHSGIINIENCTFKTNLAEQYGGAIYNNGGTLTISNSAFIGNYANTTGNAIYNNGGIVTANDTWWEDNEITPEKWNSLIGGTAATIDNYAVLNLTANNGIAYINFYRNGTNTSISVPTLDVDVFVGDESATDFVINGSASVPYAVPVGEYTLKANVNMVYTTLNLANYNIYVDTTGDEENAGGCWDSPYATIEKAVKTAMGFDKPCFIYIADGVYKVASQISISKPVTIVGQAGTIITNNVNSYWIFWINSLVTDVVIANCTFENSTTSSAVIGSAGNVIVSNCTFISSTGDYGAICSNGELTVIDSEFDNYGIDAVDIYNNVKGVLNLTNNAYSEYINNIYNIGTIVTPLTVTVLGNGTEYAKYTVNGADKNKYGLYAAITAEDGASVIGGTLKFKVGEETIEAATIESGGAYVFNYTLTKVNEYIVNATYDNGKNVSVETGILDVSSYAYVNTNGSDDNNGSNWDDAFATIEKAVAEVGEGGIIYIGNGTYEVASQITIDKTLTITGQPETIITNSKLENNRVFYVNENVKDVVFDNCTFENITKGTEWGIVIVNKGTDSIVSNCSFINITGTTGNIIDNVGSLTVMDSEFDINNETSGFDIYNVGTLNLTNNIYSYIEDLANIYNKGTIVTPIIINVLGNDTVTYPYAEDITLVATITTEDGAIVHGGKLAFDNNGTIKDATANADGTYTLEITDNIDVGEYSINATYANGNNATTNTGILSIVKANTTIDVDVAKIEKVNDNVTITVTIPFATGNVTITINNKTYSVAVKDGVATIITDKLERGVYEVVVDYAGDDNYNDNTTTFNLPVGVYYVDVTGSDDNNGSDWNDAFATIKHAVETIANGGIIYISGTTHTVDTQISIGKTVTIVGRSGTVITNDPTKKNAIFNITSTASDVVIADVTFANITTAVNGAAISNSGVNTTVDNCTFVNNTAGNYGGAIYSADDKSDLTVIDSTFINNTANYGGAINAHKGTNLIVSDSTFIDNTANSGAAIYNGAINKDYNGSITVINSEFDGNDATTDTAIYNSAKTTLNVTDNTYSGLAEDKTYIYNAGTIVSPVNIVISGNEIIYSKIGKYVILDVTITTEDGASVAIPPFKLKVGNHEGALVTITPEDGFYYVSYEVVEDDKNNYMVVTVDNNSIKDYLANTTVYTSIIDTRTIPDVDVVIDGITYGDDLVINFYINDNANGTVTITIYDSEGTIVSTQTVDVADAKDYIVHDYLLSGDYTADVLYNGDSNKYAIYGPITIDFTIAKISDFDMSSIVKDIKIGDDATVTVFVPASATGTVSITINGKTYTANVINSVAVIEGISNLSANTYDIDITYSGNDVYESQTIQDSFTVSKISDYTIDVITPTTTIKVGDDAVITIKVSEDDATGKVLVSVEGKTYEADVVGGVATVTITDLIAGTHTIAVNYTGDDKYAAKMANSSISVSKVSDYQFDIDAADIKVGDDAIIHVTVPEDAQGKVIINIDGVDHVADINKGVATFNVTGLTNGVHNIIASYDGDDKYVADKATGSINVTKAKVSDFDMVINSVEGIKVGDNVVINVTLPSDATGKVVISVNGKNYTTVAENGVATITADVFDKDGIYYITATYEGNDKYNSKNANVSVGVSKVDTYDMNVTIPDEFKPGENATINVDFPEDATGNVTVTVDGKNYTAVVKNGTADVIVPGLATGDYNVIINYSGDNKYTSNSVNKTISVTSKDDVNLTSNDVVMIYHDGSRLYAVLLDAQGNAIVNATLTFAINGVTYDKTTDANGSASIALNLDCETYDAVILYDGDKNYNAASVNATVTVNTSIIGNDIVKMYQNGTQFYATFLGSDGKALVNTTVRFNINGVFYNRTTDKNGTAKLNINLNPGNYTLTAYNPNGEEKGFNVLVKSLIETTDLTKYYRNGSSFEAKTYNKDGSIGANQTVTF